jgi:hypothetical protein
MSNASEKPQVVPATKQCSICGEEKSTTLGFSLSKKGKYGRNSACKKCDVIRQSKRRQTCAARTIIFAALEARCWKCKKTKPASLMGRDKHRKSGLNAACKACRASDPYTVLAHSKRPGQATMAITKEELGTFLALHSGLCDNTGCQKPATHTDHCHETGKVRGRLCNTCNMGLGAFGDNPQILQGALEYLLRHKGPTS